MPAPAAPPPSAPSKAPAAAPPITPQQDRPTQPGPPDAHEPTHESFLADDMAEFEQMDKADQAPPPEKPRQPDGKFKKVEEAPKRPQDEPKEEKAPETPPEPEKPVEEPKPGTMRALGKAYDEKVKLINHELQPKIQSLESKVKEYESRLEQAAKSQPDLKPMQERMSAVEKENQQLREAIRFADYRKSPEFTEKYEKPYNEAWSKAVSEVTQLNLVMEDGTSRKATANDLLALANAPLDQLDDLAAQWFPKSSARVIRHVERVRDLAEAQDTALKEAQKGAGEFHQKRTQAEQQANQAFAQAYQGANDEITRRYPKVFGRDETDPKGNETLQKGYEYADSVFSPNGANLTPQQKAGRLAVIRAKAANHDRLLSRVKANDARIAELEARIAAFEESEPPTDEAGSPGSGPRVYDPEGDDLAELRKLDR